MDSDDSENHMVAVTAKVPRELRAEIDGTAADDEPRSAALRRLIRAGLDAESGGGWRDRAGSAVALLTVMGYPTAAAATGATEIAVGWIALVVAAVLFEPWINSATERIPNPINWFRT